MASQLIDPHLGEMKPCLVPDSRFIEFTEKTEYLRHPKTLTYLKLNKENAQLAREFTGERSLAEIMREQLEATGSTQFRRILSLLLLLHQNGFLVSTKQTLQGLNFCIFQEKNALASVADVLRKLFAFNLRDFGASFNSPIPVALARVLMTPAGMLVLAFIALSNNFFPAAHRGINLDDILQYAEGSSGMAAYFLSLAVIWAGVGAVISLKNLLTAYVLSARKCDVVRPRIQFMLGLVYFDCDPIDIIGAGRTAVVRLYALRVLLPFVLLAGISLLSALGMVGGLFLPLVKEACVLVAVFSILPLADTDMNKALGILTAGTADFGQNLSFLRKRYFAHFMNMKSKAAPGLDSSHIMVVSTAVWLILSVVVFQTHVRARSGYILDHLGAGMNWSAMLMVTQLLLIVLPFLVLLAMTVYIALSNVHVLFRFPARRLKFLAQSISKQEVPASDEVVSFLREIPLFARLDHVKLEKLCGYLELIRYNSQQTIVLQGENGDAFFIIVSGMVAIEVEDEYGGTQVVDTLTTGHGFGEVSLVDNVPRTATVRAITPVSCFMLKRHHFLDFAHEWSGEQESITDIIRTSRLLMSSPLFSHLPPSQMRVLISRFERQVYEPGSLVFRQGDAAEGMYLICEGKIEVRREENGKPVFAKPIGVGEWLGEIALVKNMPRTAAAVAAEKSVLLALSKKDFYDIMQHSLMTEVEFNKLAEQRLGELRIRTLGRAAQS